MKFRLSSIDYGCPVAPAPFVVTDILPPFNCFYIFVKIFFGIFGWFYFLVFFFILLVYVCIPPPIPHGLDYGSYIVGLILGRVILHTFSSFARMF